MDVKMKTNDKVRCIKMIQNADFYDWVPNLIGKYGTIIGVITTTPIAHEPLDKPIYIVKMDEEFKVNEELKTDWGFLPEEIENA